MTPTFVPPRYETVRLLGSGQTSLVYLARHEQRGVVALKLPRPELNHRPVLRRMFESEVQITLNLHHPNIVAAYDGHPTGERAFLVLEYCAGGTLDQLLLEKGQLSLKRCFELILDVSRGLAYSHSRGVLHRDVKPANVFLTDGGMAKLGDFGTGIYLSDRTVERVGTAFYMAPEVFQGSAASIQSDIYSLGILAYEVITGVRPFLGESYDTLMMAHLSGLPKNPRHYRPELERSVAAVVAKAMSRDAAKRYATAREFIEAFAAAVGFDLAPSGSPTPAIEGQQQPQSQVGRGSRPRNGAKQEQQGKRPWRGLFGWLRRPR